MSSILATQVYFQFGLQLQFGMRTPVLISVFCTCLPLSVGKMMFLSICTRTLEQILVSLRGFLE